ncbi:hypothetical protein A5893_15785 [Pedobacter psychrophilus]|uniref:Uncharacterized protein n=1 Tax=Pedobacter psychrophilus TaxID=1826909 RepID=A0A179DCQ9_9SPHI|nr:hypothetical protein [Pedobacter psychrophilus]OAQ38253.1 hypothetical protein A5893_15785 [Pedobacter psychrophilus]
MNIEEKLNLLSKIEQVDAPPFMFTRIQQKINEAKTQEIPAYFKWSFGFVAIMIITLNITAIKVQKTDSKSGLDKVATEMQLKNNNNFYNE